VKWDIVAACERKMMEGWKRTKRFCGGGGRGF